MKDTSLLRGIPGTDSEAKNKRKDLKEKFIADLSTYRQKLDFNLRFEEENIFQDATGTKRTLPQLFRDVKREIDGVITTVKRQHRTRQIFKVVGEKKMPAKDGVELTEKERLEIRNIKIKNVRNAYEGFFNGEEKEFVKAYIERKYANIFDASASSKAKLSELGSTTEVRLNLRRLVNKLNGETSSV